MYDVKYVNLRRDGWWGAIDLSYDRIPVTTRHELEGAAGLGKTTMLKTAIAAIAAAGSSIQVVTPMKKAADIAAQELGILTDSVAALVHSHGFRWNRDVVWTRLRPGDTDAKTGSRYRGPVAQARLVKGERIVVDEAGMLDQEIALALLRITDEADATIALVGDRAQLPAVGRGGVLDFAARLTQIVVDMTSLHRFTDDAYTALTLELRYGRNPATICDQLNALGLIELHESDDDMHEVIAKTACTMDAITAAAGSGRAHGVRQRWTPHRCRRRDPNPPQ